MKASVNPTYYHQEIPEEEKLLSKVLIFKTNIKSRKKAQVVGPVLNNHPVIVDWSIDLEDIDKVLRIEASGELSEADVIRLVRPCGFHCEVLSD